MKHRLFQGMIFGIVGIGLSIGLFGKQIKATDLDAMTEIIVEEMTLQQKIYQMFIVTPEALSDSNPVISAGEITEDKLKEMPVGGIIYFKKNLLTPEQTKNMLFDMQRISCDVERLPLFLCVDEEGGRVARIGNQKAFGVPEIKSMAEIQSEEEAYQAGNTIGTYLSELGFNFDFAPDADVLTNQDNQVIGTRSFGSSPLQVTQFATAVSQGLQANQILTAFKHFPGHGATTGDTHEGFAYTDKSYEELLQCELVPFTAAQENGIDAVMVAHIAVPNVTGSTMPSSLSYHMITEILKGDLGYEGLVITDALNMGAITKNFTTAQMAVLAVQAGNDLLLMPENLEEAVNSILLAVETGQISEERIDESVKKIVRKKLEMVK